MTTALKVVGPVGALAALLSCQTYDFEPVTALAIAQTTQTKTITAKKEKPDLMILLDKSGSMASPLAGGSGCGTCVFPMCNEGTCPTRMGSVRAAMQDFLTNNGAVARMGLTIYPNSDTNACAPAGTNQQLTPIRPMSDSAADLQAWAGAINTQIQSQTVGGGTPTGDSLRFVGGLPELNAKDRDDFVLLLTDGLPNCNAMNPNVCTTPTSCRCTLANANCGTMVDDTNMNNFCRRGCLDLDGSVEAVKELRARGILTIVVGFGSDFGSGDGFEVLNAMAIAGGFQRICPMGNNSECGAGGVCDVSTHVCQTAFYSASNRTELAAALRQISENINASTICNYPLEATPSTQDLVSVIIDDVPQQAGADTWELGAGQIVMKGALCDKLKASSTANPVKVEIRIVQSL